MLIKKVITILLYFFSLQDFSQAQSRIIFDSLIIYPITNLSLRNINYNQLAPFEDILRKNDILILSEGGHVDGAAYDAQCMIIKGLIDRGKINTVYTESSWLNIEKINSVLKKYGQDSIQAVEKYMSSVELIYWTHNGFWEYLANKIIDKKVNLVGIDIETTSPLVLKELLNKATKKDSTLKSNDYKKVISDLANPIHWIFDVNYSSTLYEESKLFIKKIMHRYSTDLDYYEMKQWQRILDYLHFRYYRNFDNNGGRVLNPFDNGPKEMFFHSIRDSIMCNILLESFTNYEAGKSVLLIASYHAMHNSSTIENLDQYLKYNYVKTFGDRLHQKSNLKIYNVCFVTSSGNRGITQYSKKHYTKVKKPVKGSFENYFGRRENSFFFTDIQQISILGGKYFMNPFNKKYLYANWGKVFSGVFFIKKMYPQNFDN